MCFSFSDLKWVFGVVLAFTCSLLAGQGAVSEAGNRLISKEGTVLLLEEDFENALSPEWDLGDQDPFYSGWALAMGPDAFEGMGYAEVHGFDAEAGVCEEVTKSLRTPIFDGSELQGATVAFFQQVLPVEGKVSLFPEISVFLVPFDEYGKVSGQLIPVGRPKVQTKMEEWVSVFYDVDTNQFPALAFAVEIQYVSSFDYCPTVRIDNLVVMGIEAADIEVETVIVQPEDIGGTQVVQYGVPVDFGAELATEPVGNVRFTWVLVDAPSGIPLYPINGQNITINFPRIGSFLVWCYATVAGVVDTTPASRLILVVQNKNLDTVILEPAQERVEAVLGENLDFRSIAFGGNAATELVWTVTDSSANPESRTFIGVEPDIDFPGPGIYQVLCAARDEVGYQDPSPAKRIVEVRGSHVKIVPPDPLSPSGNLIVSAGETVTFQGQIVDLDGSFSNFFWLLNPGEQILCENLLTCPITFTDSGEYSVSFIGPLADAEPASDFLRVSVDPQLVVSILQPPQDAEFAVRDPITFIAAVSGPLAETAETFWVFGSQTFAGPEFTLEGIAEPGYYQAKFVVTDTGLNTSETRVVNFLVYDPEQPAIPRILSPKTDFLMPLGDSLFFDSSFAGLPRTEQNPLWEIRNSEDSSLIISGINQTLGNVSFPQEGLFVASLFHRSPQGNRLVERRTITVGGIDPAVFGENIDLESAAPLSFGNYGQLNFDRANFFSLIVPEDGLTLEVGLQPEEPFDVLLFNAENQQIAQRTAEENSVFQFFELASGTYKIAFIPVGPGKRKVSIGLQTKLLIPVLFFSDINPPGFDTSIGIVNTTGATADIAVNGFMTNGAPVSRISSQIKSRGVFKGTVRTLFGSQANRVTWIRVDSTQTLVGYAHSQSIDRLEAYGVNAAKNLESELFVPHIAQATQTWSTIGDLVNGSSLNANPILMVGNNMYNLANILAFSKDHFNFLAILAGMISGSSWGRVVESSGRAFLTGTEVFGKTDGTRQRVGLGLKGLPKNGPYTVGRDSLYFAHVADLTQFWTGISIVNVENVPRSVKYIAYDGTGKKLGEKIIMIGSNQKIVDVAEVILESNFPACAPANCDPTQCICNHLTTAWFEVIGEGNLVGYELFGTSNVRRMAGIESITEVKKKLCFPFLEPGQGYYHGVALVNVSNDPNQQNLIFRLYDAQGGLLATNATKSLGRKQKTIFLLRDLFGPPLPSAGAWVEVESARELVGFELFGDDGTFEYMSGIIAQ